MTYDEMPTSDDTLVWDTWLSLHYLPAVTIADELGILKSLHASPAGAEAIASRLGLDRRATVATLRLLAALGFLVRRDGAYHLTEATRLYLLRDSPFYWGHMLRADQPQHARLREWLQGRSPTGRPGAGGTDVKETPGSSSAWASGRVDIDRARRVAAAMQSHSLAASIALARNGGFDGVRHLLDVGGGSGCYSIALARRHPVMRCTVMELAAMCDVAMEYVRDAGVEDRIDTAAVDMFRQPWPRGYDAVLFSNVFHDWNFETCAWLGERAYEALDPGGRVFLHEMLLDDDGDGPVTAASFSMLMLGTQGQQFTFPELRGLLEGAGFRDIAAKHTYGYYSVVTGRKQ